MRIEIQNSSLEVFVKGEYLARDKNAVAIVGARQASKRGEKLAYKFSYDLAKNGVTIISGLAIGIDSMVHRGALDANGRTIAVLAHGLDIIYPKDNFELANKIMKNGCLMTKFPVGTIPVAKNFLARNQLIAGLSKVVLVIEGKTRSGTLSTANHAANLGVEVFAIPGSGATDKLIEDGANPVNSPQEILEYLSSLT